MVVKVLMMMVGVICQICSHLVGVFKAHKMSRMLPRNNADANFRSLPAFSNAAPSAPSEPYVSYGSEAGSYTISY